jgi:hypothetical protein
MNLVTPPGLVPLLAYMSIFNVTLGFIGVVLLRPWTMRFELHQLRRISEGLLFFGMASGLLMPVINGHIITPDHCLEVRAWQYDPSGGLFNPSRLAVSTDQGVYILSGNSALVTTTILEQGGTGWYRTDMAGDEKVKQFIPRRPQNWRPDSDCSP